MPNINPVDLQTLGARVTDSAQLTEGRWYAVRVNCSGTHNPLVHALYMGMVGRSLHEFEVCADDYRALNRSLGLAKLIHREDSSIRTGQINGGGVCEVFKFKQVKDEPVSIPRKSPYSIGNCRHNGIKEGDKFVLVSDSGSIQKGTIVTLVRDDDSLCPYFKVPGFHCRQAIYLWRLAPVSPTGRMTNGWPAIPSVPKAANQSNTSAPAATLSTVDQFKSEIDALRAKVQQKRDQIAELSEEIVGFTQAIEDTREKLKASLEGYI